MSAPNTLPASGSGSASAVQAVLRAVNKARAAQGWPGYTLSARLDSGAAAHDRTMAGGCGLSHQCPGEPPLGQRESAQGVQWTACGENIGEGGGVAASASAEAAMAVGLTRQMLAEQPPHDGHRRNLLSPHFTHIGIAVIRDSSGTVWMTQDFSN